MTAEFLQKLNFLWGKVHLLSVLRYQSLLGPTSHLHRPLFLASLNLKALWSSVEANQISMILCPLRKHAVVKFHLLAILVISIPSTFIYLFVCLWLRWVFIATHGFSLVAASRGCSLLRCTGFSLQWFLLCAAPALGAQASVAAACGLSSCGFQALEHRLSSCGTRA